jgi:hypothetical protein
MYNWTHEQAISYEVARETIGHMIAIKSGELHNEKIGNKEHSPKVDELLNEIALLSKERSNLEVTDEESVKRIRETYGTVIKKKHATKH